MLKAPWSDEEGLTLVEHAIVLALLAIGAITAWAELSHHARAKQGGARFSRGCGMV